MKATIDTTAFLQAVQRASVSAGYKSNLPILNNLLLDFRKDKLFVTGTNLDTAVETRCDAAIEEPFSTTVDAKKLLNIARSFPKGVELHLKLEKTHIAINCDGSKFKLLTISADEFPALPSFEHSFSATIKNATTMLASLRDVLHAQSQDETRYILNGTLIEFAQNELTFVATDGRRIAHSIVPVVCTESTPIVLPKKAAEIVCSYMGQNTCAIFKNERMVKFDFGTDILYSKLVEGKFPDWRKVAGHKDTYKCVKLRADSMFNEVGRVSIMSAENSMSVHLKFENNLLTLSTVDAINGEASSTMTCEFDGDIAINLNPKYLQEILKRYEEETVSIHLKDELSPACFVGRNLFSTVMPLRK